eukprot:600775-Amphidinium_carterae.1
MASSRQIQTIFEIALLVWIGRTANSFHSAKALQLAAWQAPRPEEGESTLRFGFNVLVLGMMWNAWIMLCLTVATPSAVYAAVHAVPGALGDSRALQVAIAASVSLLTATSTSY